MQYEIEISGRRRRATVHRADGKFIVEIDGRRWTIDAERVDGQSMSLLIDEMVRLPPSLTLRPTAEALSEAGRRATPERPSGGKPDTTGEMDTASVIGETSSVMGQTSSVIGEAPVVVSGFPSTKLGAGSRTSSYDVTVAPDGASGQLAVSVGTRSVMVSLNGRRRGHRRADGAQPGGGVQRIVAPMPGKIIRVPVRPGDAVRARQPVVVIEAMKMENELRAARDGVVTEIHAREGQSVEAGELLAVIAADVR